MDNSRVEQLIEGRVTLHCGDCLAVLATLEANSIDACVTDPPYHLTSGNASFDWAAMGPGQKRPNIGSTNRGGRGHKTGFMGKSWDGGDIAFRIETWAAVYRALKPGSYIVAFSSSRTYHRMACAIEDAGFITHPLVAWITGQGFPKAHSVSKHIDRMAGVEREIVGLKRHARDGNVSGQAWSKNGNSRGEDYCTNPGTIGPGLETLPATDAAREWEGYYYGTQSLKPAIEPIYVGQKPFEKGLNGTQNILKWGVGALNIDGCRVASDGGVKPRGSSKLDTDMHEGWARPWMEDRGEVQKRHDDAIDRANTLGRWPANVIHDGSDEVVGAFPNSHGGGSISNRSSPKTAGIYGAMTGEGERWAGYADDGSAARFFYTAKADSDDRLGSKHPTVKPLDLMQYLCRLVGRKGALILDLFAGTGTTGVAAVKLGRKFIGIEIEPKYFDIACRRISEALKQPDMFIERPKPPKQEAMFKK